MLLATEIQPEGFVIRENNFYKLHMEQNVLHLFYVYLWSYNLDFPSLFSARDLKKSIPVSVKVKA